MAKKKSASSKTKKGLARKANKTASGIKHDLPLLAPLTTLNFGHGAAQRYYHFRGLPLPHSLSYEQQLDDIERVSPRARKYIEDIQRYHERLTIKRSGIKTKFDLPSLANKDPFALAGILEIMAEPYCLPLSLNVPVSDKTFTGLNKALGLKNTDNPYSLDILLTKWANRPSHWHLSQADRLEELAAYLAVEKGMEKFVLGQTDSKASSEKFSAARCLLNEAHRIRQAYSHSIKPITNPPSFVLSIVLTRLKEYLLAVSKNKKFPTTSLITAIVKAAPYSRSYKQYGYLEGETIRKLLSPSGKSLFL